MHRRLVRERTYRMSSRQSIFLKRVARVDGQCQCAPVEPAVDESLLGMVVGVMVLAIATYAVLAHYRRERRRADLLRNLDHHDWWHWTRSRH